MRPNSCDLGHSGAQRRAAIGAVRCQGNLIMIDFSALPNTSLAGRVARFPLKILPSGMVVPIMQGRLKGRKWIVGSHRHACWLGCYEPEVQNLVAHEVEPAGVFYDIGAMVGFYSLLASIVIGPGRVYAFEPVPRNISYLCRHLALNNI